jgi:hypothetical protein
VQEAAHSDVKSHLYNDVSQFSSGVAVVHHYLLLHPFL